MVHGFKLSFHIHAYPSYLSHLIVLKEREVLVGWEIGLKMRDLKHDHLVRERKESLREFFP